MPKGTMTFEDIYGAGSLDTLSDSAETSQQTNPNNGDVAGNTNPTEKSIFNIKGNFLGQPIMVWLGIIILLVVVKFVVEKEGK